MHIIIMKHRGYSRYVRTFAPLGVWGPTAPESLLFLAASPPKKGEKAKALYVLFLLAALVVLSACQRGPIAGARPKLAIAWVSKSLGNPVFELARTGALQKAKELSASGPYDVELLAVGPVSADAIEQARMMNDLIARRVDGMAVSCNDPTACIDPIDRAAQAGIPVMTWDSDSPDISIAPTSSVSSSVRPSAPQWARPSGPARSVRIRCS